MSTELVDRILNRLEEASSGYHLKIELMEDGVITVNNKPMLKVIGPDLYSVVEGVVILWCSMEGFLSYNTRWAGQGFIRTML